MPSTPGRQSPILRFPGSWARTAGVVGAAWGVFGVLLGQQVYALRAGNGPLSIWSHALVFELNYCFFCALLTPVILLLGRKFLLKRPQLWRHLCIHLIASIAFALAVQTAHVVALTTLFGSWFPPAPPHTLPRSLMSTVDYGAILYWVVLFCAHFLEYVRRFDLAQVRQTELQGLLAEAQLQTLKMQMHPHFLFNALNSVSELIHQDPVAADRMVVRMSELLRTYLRNSETQQVSLAQEVSFLQRYLEVQQMRFEERLIVRIEMDPGSENASVPSLILQPLVENCIRHGIADRESDASVEIASKIEGRSLHLHVADNGSGEPPDAGATFTEGTGLRNTRCRLEKLYGPRHSFTVEQSAGGGVRAVICIPFEQLGVEQAGFEQTGSGVDAHASLSR